MIRSIAFMITLCVAIAGCASPNFKSDSADTALVPTAAKLCKEIETSAPCCCVEGNFGECMSKADCANLSLECVPDKEHFRCTAGDSAIKAWVRGKREAKAVRGGVLASQAGDKTCVKLFGSSDQTTAILENSCDAYLKVTVKWQSPSAGAGIYEKILTYHLNPKWQRPLYQWAQTPMIVSVQPYEESGSTEAAAHITVTKEYQNRDSDAIWFTNNSMKYVAVTYSHEFRLSGKSVIAKSPFLLRPGERAPVTYLNRSYQSFLGFLFAAFDPD